MTLSVKYKSFLSNSKHSCSANEMYDYGMTEQIMRLVLQTQEPG